MKYKTLYVSDLDGTLFNSKKCVSEYTIQTLNQCIAKGMRFTVATARMAYGCDYRLSEIRLNTPGILTNGVFLYDFSKKEIVSTECIRRDSAKKAVDAFGKNGLSCFIYVYEGSQISIFYNDKKMEEQTQYYSDRAIESCKNVCLTEDAFCGAQRTLMRFRADAMRIITDAPKRSILSFSFSAESLLCSASLPA